MVFFYLCCFLPVFFSVSLLQTCRKQSNASIWSIFISFSVCSCQSVINVDDRASGSGLNPGWTDAQKAAERRLIRSRRWILASHSWGVFCSSFPVPSCPHLAPSIVFYLAGKAAAGLKQNMIYLQLRFQRLRVGFCVKTRGNSRLKAGGIQVVLEDVELVKLCSPFSSKSNKKEPFVFSPAGWGTMDSGGSSQGNPLQGDFTGFDHKWTSERWIWGESHQNLLFSSCFMLQMRHTMTVRPVSTPPPPQGSLKYVTNYW